MTEFDQPASPTLTAQAASARGRRAPCRRGAKGSRARGCVRSALPRDAPSLQSAREGTYARFERTMKRAGLLGGSARRSVRGAGQRPCLESAGVSALCAQSACHGAQASVLRSGFAVAPWRSREAAPLRRPAEFAAIAPIAAFLHPHARHQRSIRALPHCSRVPRGEAIPCGLGAPRDASRAKGRPCRTAQPAHERQRQKWRATSPGAWQSTQSIEGGAAGSNSARRASSRAAVHGRNFKAAASRTLALTAHRPAARRPERHREESENVGYARTRQHRSNCTGAAQAPACHPGSLRLSQLFRAGSPGHAGRKRGHHRSAATSGGARVTLKHNQDACTALACGYPRAPRGSRDSHDTWSARPLLCSEFSTALLWAAPQLYFGPHGPLGLHLRNQPG